MRVICLMTILLLSTMASAKPRQPEISSTRYVVGGLVGSTLGFGLGHAIQGRYWYGAGWGFTLSQMYALMARDEDEEYDMKLALSSLIGLKIFESISIWSPAPTFSTREITSTRYVTGGLLGTTLGFGSGHVLQGRWLDGGWPYTVSQLLSVYIISAPCKVCEDEGAFTIAPLIGGFMLLVSKLLETISLWTPSLSEYHVTPTANDTITLAPIVQGRGLGLLLAKSM